ncbi:MAG TPA: AIR synthase-related protein [Drouetiella sp.]|jgi:phosphoribosylformylglycinamidine synthase subunit PurSL
MSQMHGTSQTANTPSKPETTLQWCLSVIPKSDYSAFPLYWIRIPERYKNQQEELTSALREVLIDPLQEELWVAKPEERDVWIEQWNSRGFRWWAEKQFLPGVTDNLAHTVQEALELKKFPDVSVSSGAGFIFRDRLMSAEDAANLRKTLTMHKIYSDAEAVEKASRYTIYHPLADLFRVHDLSADCSNELLTFPAVRLPEPPSTVPVNLELDDSGLETLSKDRLLALTLGEMRTIRNYFRQKHVQQFREKRGLPTNPTDVELEILAQTWSEHCKHKIFNATISHVDFSSGGRNKVVVKSLYKTYIQGPTRELMSSRKDLLSVFKDNSGVVKWNDDTAVCFKVETHNSPSALEPYGGALTGILGVNRDILGTGLGAKPIFNTDIFCFAYPSAELPTRPKLLPAKAIMDGVRKGVEDGGNKSGIPTINGAIFFHPGYRAKPLVFCGTGGVLPLDVHGKCGYEKHTQVGDTIVMVGGRVGKDGIHGATFSSESLHEGSPMSAVQIGDPFTQKRVLDFIIEARDLGLITGITDNGAGGLSSSVGEMAQITHGATIELDKIPTKYPGLADWELVVSESQERMTLSTTSLEKLQKLAQKHHVEATAIGTFHNQGFFEVTRGGKPVALLDLEFLHDGLPALELEAEWRPSQITMTSGTVPADLSKYLLRLLAHPNISSREQVIRQYDHEVQGMSVIKPLMGERQQAPCDAAVIIPIYGDTTGLAVSNGLSPRLSFHDAHLMAICAVDEAIRNMVCVGADPDTVTLLDNFCWPDPVHGPKNTQGKLLLAMLVRACQGLADAVRAYKAPLISGKDSMKNDFDDGVVRLSIPPTLLISGMARVPDVSKCVSMDFKQPGDLIYLLKVGKPGLAGSHYEEMLGWQSALIPQVDLPKAAQMYRLFHKAIEKGMINSAHDLSEGGLGVAISECIIGSGKGAKIDLTHIIEIEKKHSEASPFPFSAEKVLSRIDTMLFAEGPARLLVSIDPSQKSEWEQMWKGFDCHEIGTVADKPRLTIWEGEVTVIDVALMDLERSWRTALPFD